MRSGGGVGESCDDCGEVLFDPVEAFCQNDRVNRSEFQDRVILDLCEVATDPLHDNGEMNYTVSRLSSIEKLDATLEFFNRTPNQGQEIHCFVGRVHSVPPIL